uniref:Uncharacterized protein n=1 Tax=Pipistrellus kuhlii TaxID=59472 RepID=A0A7J7TXK8_PIPKU|nr:hypothetical protein mPipKuh1_009207 [Pipistrellus kuhlii]
MLFVFTLEGVAQFGVSSHAPKGHRFNPRSGQCMAGNLIDVSLSHQCFSHSLSLSLSLKAIKTYSRVRSKKQTKDLISSQSSNNHVIFLLQKMITKAQKNTRNFLKSHISICLYLDLHPTLFHPKNQVFSPLCGIIIGSISGL